MAAPTPYQQIKHDVQLITSKDPTIIPRTADEFYALNMIDKERYHAIIMKTMDQLKAAALPLPKLNMSPKDIDRTTIDEMLQITNTLQTVLNEIDAKRMMIMILYKVETTKNRYPSHADAILSFTNLLNDIKSTHYQKSSNLNQLDKTSPNLILREILDDYNQLLRSAPTKLQQHIHNISRQPDIPNQDIVQIIESLREVYNISEALSVDPSKISTSIENALIHMMQRANETTLNNYTNYQTGCTQRSANPQEHLQQISAKLKENPPLLRFTQPVPPNFPIIDTIINEVAANAFMAEQISNQNQHQHEYRGNSFRNNYNNYNQNQQYQQRPYASHPYNNNNYRLCHAYQSGNCRFGSNCRFSHNLGGDNSYNNQQDTNQRNNNSGNRQRQHTHNHSNASKRAKFSKTDVNK